MPDYEKISLMAQIAIFEKRQGKDIIEISRYFRSDYISRKVLFAVLHYTMCFLMVTAMVLLMRLESFLGKPDLVMLMEGGKRLSIIYLAGAALIALISYVVSAGKYERVHRLSLYYMSKLEKLLEMEEDEVS